MLPLRLGLVKKLTFIVPRSPDRGRFARDQPAIDSYVPCGGRAARPRSRSAGDRYYASREPAKPDSWRGRARSPLPPPTRPHDSRDAYFSRDSRPRSPRREYGPPLNSRYNGPPRAGSPAPLKRGREASLNGRGPRSPPPAKRERLASPPREYIRARR